MKSLKILTLIALGLVGLQANAQTETPKGFTSGKVVLADNTVISGFFKEKIQSSAAVVFLTEDKKKKTYNGSDLLSAEIGDDKYICIKGDFFKVICDGELKFVQKASDASFKPIYNGNQAVFANGTEGKPGDYFVYNQSAKQLNYITKKTVGTVVPELFSGCEEAIAKAKELDTDISRFGEAVVIYNSRKK